jgi:hypothetical protein
LPVTCNVPIDAVPLGKRPEIIYTCKSCLFYAEQWVSRFQRLVTLLHTCRKNGRGCGLFLLLSCIRSHCLIVRIGVQRKLSKRMDINTLSVLTRQLAFTFSVLTRQAAGLHIFCTYETGSSHSHSLCLPDKQLVFTFSVLTRQAAGIHILCLPDKQLAFTFSVLTRQATDIHILYTYQAGRQATFTFSVLTRQAAGIHILCLPDKQLVFTFSVLTKQTAGIHILCAYQKGS